MDDGPDFRLADDEEVARLGGLMDTRILLVRHGATVLSAEDRFAGATNVQLSDAGREQARGLSRRLAGVPIAAFYASPMDRTMETASILAEPHGLPIQPEPAFLEINHGAWEGLTRHEAETKYADDYLRWEEDPYNFAPQGGETGLALTARAMPGLLRVVAAHQDETVCVVSHKATIRLLLSAILGFDARRYRDHLDLNPASLTIVDFRDNLHARLTVYNDVAHYSPDGLALPGVPGGRLSKAWSGTGA
jgi:probable phosphoglycerate mutase